MFADRRARKARGTSDPESLVRYSTDDIEAVRQAVAENPATPPSAMIALATDPAWYVRHKLAQNRNVTPESLALLARGDVSLTLEIVATNPTTPPEALRILSTYERDAREKLQRMLAKASPRELADERNLKSIVIYQTLMERADVSVKVARNPSTSPAVLRSMAGDPARKVKETLATNGNTPPDVHEQLAAYWPAHLAMEYAEDEQSPLELLDRLSEHRDEAVRRRVARNPNTSLQTMRRLSEDEDEYVRVWAAANPHAPLDMLIRLALDRSSAVREMVGRQSDAPLDVRLQGTEAVFGSRAEQVFWVAYLEAKPEALDGLVAQYEIGRYRVDFALPAVKVAIEIDGLEYHSDQDTFVSDRRRERELELGGWRVLRFAAKEVFGDPRGCITESARWVAKIE